MKIIGVHNVTHPSVITRTSTKGNQDQSIQVHHPYQCNIDSFDSQHSFHDRNSHSHTNLPHDDVSLHPMLFGHNSQQ